MDEVLKQEIRELIKQNEKTDSIELTKNSKGYTWSIKIYGDLMSEDNTILSRVEQYNKDIKEKFVTTVIV